MNGQTLFQIPQGRVIVPFGIMDLADIIQGRTLALTVADLLLAFVEGFAPRWTICPYRAGWH
jgi:hypothetical protein